MVRSTSSFCFSICAITVGGYICFLQLIRPEVDSMSLAGCQPHQSCAPLEFRKTFSETKTLCEKCLEDYESCNLEKAECIGQQFSQDKTMQKYSFLLSDYQMMHQSVYSRQGSLTGMQKERIVRIGIHTKPSMIQWKSETGNELSIPPPIEATFETQQDIVHRLQNRDNMLCRERFSVGPYYVQFAFSVGQGIEEHAAIIIEIPSRLYLPHTVLTFLTLVEAEQYSRSRVSLSPTALSIEPNQLDETHEAHRLSRATLGFIESSTKFPCTTNSVGFLGYGPQFMVFFDDSGAEESANNHTCFGRIVRGMSSIKALQSDAANDSTIQVAWSRNLRL